jgi:hypothetical protein
MEKTNFDFLCEDLKYLGFGDSLNRSLEEKIKSNSSPFELYHSGKINDEPVDAILYFAKPGPNGSYFFSDYLLTLGDKLQHFKIFKGKGVTLKEGYNLLCGRAVFKQLIGKNGQKYNTWIELDLKKKEGENFKVITYHESYGYDLSATLAEFQIETPSSNWDRSMLLKSLQRGNLQAAFLNENGGMKKVFIEANPKDKTITIRDNDFSTTGSATWPLPVEADHSETDDIENSLNKKTSRAKKLKDI